MDFLKLSGGSIDFFKKALDYKAERHNLLASNIANSETPGYKAVDISFEDQMKQVLDAKNGKGLSLTHEKHLNGMVSRLGQVTPEFLVDRSAGRLDGNNVDMDREMSRLAENTLTYNAVSQILAKKFAGLKFAIEAGGK
ncbi:MAG: flagellar basal body rod protein FlgB [Nitrospinota bacterium]